MSELSTSMSMDCNAKSHMWLDNAEELPRESSNCSALITARNPDSTGSGIVIHAIAKADILLQWAHLEG
jgi:hypothetical protein